MQRDVPKDNQASSFETSPQHKCTHSTPSSRDPHVRRPGADETRKHPADNQPPTDHRGQTPNLSRRTEKTTEHVGLINIKVYSKLSSICTSYITDPSYFGAYILASLAWTTLRWRMWPVPCLRLSWAFWPHLKCLIAASGYPHFAHFFFWMW